VELFRDLWSLPCRGCSGSGAEFILVTSSCTAGLVEVVQRICNAGFKLKPYTCCLLRTKVVCLGHVVSGDVVRLDAFISYGPGYRVRNSNFKNMCQTLDVQNRYKRASPARRWQRFNRTLLRMIRAHLIDQQNN